MDEIVFSSQDELYKRVLPALRSKKKLLSKDGFKSIELPEIWRREVKATLLFKMYEEEGNEESPSYGDLANIDEIITSNVDISEYCLKERRKKSTIEMSLPKLK